MDLKADLTLQTILVNLKTNKYGAKETEAQRENKLNKNEQILMVCGIIANKLTYM